MTRKINFVNMHYKTKLHLASSIQKLMSEHINHETILGRHYTQSFSPLGLPANTIHLEILCSLCLSWCSFSSGLRKTCYIPLHKAFLEMLSKLVLNNVNLCWVFSRTQGSSKSYRKESAVSMPSLYLHLLEVECNILFFTEENCCYLFLRA